MDSEIEAVIKKLGLQKLWDQDFLKEGYCSKILIQPEHSPEKRPLFNWAYYLIPQGCVFPLHKLLSDESWQYCLGGPIDLFLIENEEIKKVRVGPDIFSDQQIFYIVEKNTWFAATPAPESKFTLVSHCVSPGWIPQDDIAGYYDEMIALAPKHVEFIKKFSWPKSKETRPSHEAYKTMIW